LTGKLAASTGGTSARSYQNNSSYLLIAPQTNTLRGASGLASWKGARDCRLAVELFETHEELFENQTSEQANEFLIDCEKYEPIDPAEISS
jgi:hypothetical protein